MLAKLNAGWTYTVLALLCCVTSIPLILAETRWGMKWRGEREEKLRKKMLAKQAADVEEAEGTEVEQTDIPVHRSWSQGTSDDVHN
jgi:hypothetical protein